MSTRGPAPAGLDELAPRTIDRLLAMDDAELGLATLLGLIPLPDPPARRR